MGLDRQPESRLQRRFAGISWINRPEDCPLEPSRVLNLADEPIAEHRWIPERERTLWQSRRGTLTEGLSSWPETLAAPSEVIISGSAIGYYGTFDGAKTESSPAGFSFSAELCQAWENAPCARLQTSRAIMPEIPGPLNATAPNQMSNCRFVAQHLARHRTPPGTADHTGMGDESRLAP